MAYWLPRHLYQKVKFLRSGVMSLTLWCRKVNKEKKAILGDREKRAILGDREKRAILGDREKRAILGDREKRAILDHKGEQAYEAHEAHEAHKDYKDLLVFDKLWYIYNSRENISAEAETFLTCPVLCIMDCQSHTEKESS
jgi:hypothetical protein